MNTQHHYLANIYVYDKSSTPACNGSLEDYLQADHGFDLQHTEPSQPITQNLCVTKELDDELKRDKEMEESRDREGESQREREINVISLHVQL